MIKKSIFVRKMLSVLPDHETRVIIPSDYARKHGFSLTKTYCICSEYYANFVESTQNFEEFFDDKTELMVENGWVRVWDGKHEILISQKMFDPCSPVFGGEDEIQINFLSGAFLPENIDLSKFEEKIEEKVLFGFGENDLRLASMLNKIGVRTSIILDFVRSKDYLKLIPTPDTEDFFYLFLETHFQYHSNYHSYEWLSQNFTKIPDDRFESIIRNMPGPIPGIIFKRLLELIGEEAFKYLSNFETDAFEHIPTNIKILDLVGFVSMFLINLRIGKFIASNLTHPDLEKAGFLYISYLYNRHQDVNGLCWILSFDRSNGVGNPESEGIGKLRRIARKIFLINPHVADDVSRFRPFLRIIRVIPKSLFSKYDIEYIQEVNPNSSRVSSLYFIPCELDHVAQKIISEVEEYKYYM